MDWFGGAAGRPAPRRGFVVGRLRRERRTAGRQVPKVEKGGFSEAVLEAFASDPKGRAQSRERQQVTHVPVTPVRDGATA